MIAFLCYDRIELIAIMNSDQHLYKITSLELYTVKPLFNELLVD
jgi:hypothetical protein